MYISIYTYLYIFICCHFKLKTEAQVIFLNTLSLAHRANGSFLFVCLLTKKLSRPLLL